MSPLPAPADVAANLLMLQDVLGVPALSAGVWYVAIDLQLFALLMALCALPTLLGTAPRPARGAAAALVGALTVASLFHFNLDARLDMWAPYFFGAYGLGIAAFWVSRQPRRRLGLALLAVLVVAALAFDGRSRIAVAGATALALAAAAWSPAWRPCAHHRVMAFLARTSFPVFLLHYPVLVAVGAVVHRLAPENAVANAAGLIVAWAAALGAGAWMHRWLEPAVASTRRAPRSDDTMPSPAEPGMVLPLESTTGRSRVDSTPLYVGPRPRNNASASRGGEQLSSESGRATVARRGLSA